MIIYSSLISYKLLNNPFPDVSLDNIFKYLIFIGNTLLVNHKQNFLSEVDINHSLQDTSKPTAIELVYFYSNMEIQLYFLSNGIKTLLIQNKKKYDHMVDQESALRRGKNKCLC